MGTVQPLFRFQLPGGEEGVILASQLHGWAPLKSVDATQRPENMQELDEPLRIRTADGREEVNPFAQGRRALSGVAPSGINRP